MILTGLSLWVTLFNVFSITTWFELGNTIKEIKLKVFLYKE